VLFAFWRIWFLRWLNFAFFGLIPPFFGLFAIFITFRLRTAVILPFRIILYLLGLFLGLFGAERLRLLALGDYWVGGGLLFRSAYARSPIWRFRRCVVQCRNGGDMTKCVLLIYGRDDYQRLAIPDDLDMEYEWRAWHACALVRWRRGKPQSSFVDWLRLRGARTATKDELIVFDCGY